MEKSLESEWVITAMIESPPKRVQEMLTLTEMKTSTMRQKSWAKIEILQVVRRSKSELSIDLKRRRKTLASILLKIKSHQSHTKAALHVQSQEKERSLLLLNMTLQEESSMKLNSKSTLQTKIINISKIRSWRL